MLSFIRQVQKATLCLPRLCHSGRGGTSLSQGPDHPPCLPLVPAQRTPCSRVPSPPSKHTACLSLILLLAPGLCPPRRPLRARGSLDTAHFTLTLASLPLGVVSWGGEGLPHSSKVLAGRNRILFSGTSRAPGAPWPCAGQEFNNCLLNGTGTWQKMTCQFTNYFTSSTCERIFCGDKLFIFSSKYPKSLCC